MATAGIPILSIDNQDYLLYPTKVSLKKQLKNKVARFNQAFVAVTAIEWNNSTFAKSDLEDVVRQYEEKDDVWTEDFLSLVILLQASKVDCTTSSKRFLPINNAKAQLPVGPLAIETETGHVFMVAKLQRDTHLAFSSSMLPSLRTKAIFKEFSMGENIAVPLPSKLYYPVDESRPLNGVRVAVKDTIALRGLRTSFGSQAWLETYPPEEYTAPCIRKLIDYGAVIIGKVKTTEFAEGLSAHEWVHSPCPYNPRGDGEQEASSSSTGSAAAVAAYEWLDVAIGTDTGGSIRHPAAVNGIFGQRPSTGRVDLEGVLGATDLFNTVGIFARKIDTFARVGGCLAGQTLHPRRAVEGRKFNLLYPTRAPQTAHPDPHHGGQHRWFPHPEVDPINWSEAEKEIEQVVVKMEKLFDCKRQPFNINEMWRATPVIGQPRSLDEAVGHIYSAVTTSSAVRNSIDDFITTYKQNNNGQDPPMSKTVKARLAHGRTVSDATIAKSINAMMAFSDWTENTLFSSFAQDSTTLLIFPQTCGRPDYRDKAPSKGPLFNDTFSIYAFGYLVGCPDYTLPVAEVPYQSTVTGNIEYLPASISLIGRPGTDLDLFDIVEHLHKHGVVRDVAAGPRMFSEE